MSHPKKKPAKNKKHPDTKVETPKEIIPGKDHSKKDPAEASHSTITILHSIKQKLDQQEIEDIYVDTMESVIESIVEPVTETAEPPVHLFDNNPEEKEIAFNAGSSETDTENTTSSLLEFFQENLETTRQLAINSAKKYFNLYNQNTNIALNINQTLMENALNSQMERLDHYKNWFSGMKRE